MSSYVIEKEIVIVSFRVDYVLLHVKQELSLLAHYKNAHVSQYFETADTAPCADNEDANSNLKEDYRKLKNNFERLNTIYQERIAELNDVKASYAVELDEASQKYASVLTENEELKERVDVLFKLGRGYLEGKNCSCNAEKMNNEDQIDLNAGVKSNPKEQPTSNSNSKTDSWSSQVSRGFRKVRFSNTNSTGDRDATQDVSLGKTVNERLQEIANRLM